MSYFSIVVYQHRYIGFIRLFSLLKPTKFQGEKGAGFTDITGFICMK